MSDNHNPVLLTPAIEALNIQPEGVYVDATFGRGGHAEAILARLSNNGRLIAIDKDLAAYTAGQKLAAADTRFTIFHSSFARLKKFALQEGVVGDVAGVLLDLGVSSPQLDDADRGCSFSKDGPLDMRMDQTAELNAEKWLALVDEATLIRVLREYGEEKYAKRIGKAIVTSRAIQPITTTKQLADIIMKAHPAWPRNKHPATKSFLAIRIFINNELEELKAGLEAALEILKTNGRLAVISFHSLEDGIVKRFINHHAKGDYYPVGIPVKQRDIQPRLRKIGKAIKPGAEEIDFNPRARSAVLRIAEKIK